ncbi:hypothetical protein K3148_03090 [Qipengyuania aurantiaca]|uniref:PAS domain-containing protein n=1 Tax=Qipengyuania aurantiaca TaxID=2867233 RepID=A0ABX8ZQL2_9SPHN|nr:hypothetical protein [Qipengyuania aurantiaca]QZD90394.1 hypothetical protein K3148_03090 [Qipengyuania aurantiaca]
MSEKVAGRLSHAIHVIFASGPHGQILNINRCAIQVIADFPDNPRDKLDHRCFAGEKPLPLILPEIEMNPSP